MRLPNGVTIAIGGRKFSGEIPDNLVGDDVKKAIDAAAKQEKAAEAKAKKPAVEPVKT